MSLKQNPIVMVPSLKAGVIETSILISKQSGNERQIQKPIGVETYKERTIAMHNELSQQRLYQISFPE